MPLGIMKWILGYSRDAINIKDNRSIDRNNDNDEIIIYVHFSCLKVKLCL